MKGDVFVGRILSVAFALLLSLAGVVGCGELLTTNPQSAGASGVASTRPADAVLPAATPAKLTAEDKAAIVAAVAVEVAQKTAPLLPAPVGEITSAAAAVIGAILLKRRNQQAVGPSPPAVEPSGN